MELRPTAPDPRTGRRRIGTAVSATIGAIFALLAAAPAQSACAPGALTAGDGTPPSPLWQPVDPLPGLGPQPGWRFGVTPTEAAAPDHRVSGRKVDGEQDRRGLAIHNQPGIRTLVEGLDVRGAKEGLSLRGTGETLIYDLSFRELRSDDGFGAAIHMGGGGTPTRGPVRIALAEADGGMPPLESYDQSNTDFLSSERGNAPTLIKYLTAQNFSDAIVDAKAPVMMSNVTLGSAHRVLRIWSGQWMILANAEVTVPEGRSAVWLDGPETMLLYHNVSWNGEPHPDKSLVQGNGQAVPLPVNPLPGLSPFFAHQIESVALEFTADCGDSWTDLLPPQEEPAAAVETAPEAESDAAAAPAPEERPAAFRGDPRFSVTPPGAGHLRARVTLTDGEEGLSGVLALPAGAAPLDLHLADLPPAGMLADWPPAPEAPPAEAAAAGDLRALVTPVLVDAETGDRIAVLRDGGTVPGARLAGRELTILAEVTPTAEIRSVFFDFNDGAIATLERIAPYALFGDDGPEELLAGMTLPPGEHTLSLTAFADSDAKSPIARERWRFRVLAAGARD